jgi:hypothetical protein
MSRYDGPSHQVYMYFFLRSGWQVQFLEADLKTPLPWKLTFNDPHKIRELARRLNRSASVTGGDSVLPGVLFGIQTSPGDVP